MLTLEEFRDMVVIDTHVDTILRFVDLGHDLADDGSPGYMDLAKTASGNIAGAFFACCVEPQHVAAGRGPQRLDQLLRGLHDFLERNPERAELARSPGDILRLRAAGKLAVLPCIEGAQAIGPDLDRLATFKELGVAYVSPTHFATNDWADSSTDREVHGGLSPLGRTAIAELNRLKIAVDVSHISDAAFWQALEHSRAPVFASHSSARALVPHPRNLTDDMMRALAGQRGLIGITWWPEYIATSFQLDLEHLAFADHTKPRRPGESAIARMLDAVSGDPVRSYEVLTASGVAFPAVNDVVDHLIHAVEVVGADHVCMGTDHGAVNFRLNGLDDCRQTVVLANRLSARGLSAAEIAKVLGGNVLRYLEEISGRWS